jgi:hypothetical protein
MPKKKGGVVDSRFDVGALKQKERDITAQFEDAEDAEECERVCLQARVHYSTHHRGYQ